MTTTTIAEAVFTVCIHGLADLGSSPGMLAAHPCAQCTADRALAAGEIGPELEDAVFSALGSIAAW